MSCLKEYLTLIDLQMFRDLSLITVEYKEDIRIGMDCYQSGESVVLRPWEMCVCDQVAERVRVKWAVKNAWMINIYVQWNGLEYIAHSIEWEK